MNSKNNHGEKDIMLAKQTKNKNRNANKILNSHASNKTQSSKLQNDVKQEKSSSRFTHHPSLAFTLAEVLITLGIIGVVAALTIPALLNNNQKQVAMTQLKEFYSLMSQAVIMSENDNGAVSEWDFGNAKDGNSTLTWFKTYLAPYIKYTKEEITTAGQTCDITFANSSVVRFWKSGSIAQIHAFLYTNNVQPDKAIYGKNAFIFFIDGITASQHVHPYDSGLDASDTSRTKWTTGDYACTVASENKAYCTGLLQYENWTVPSDYPFWN